MYGTNLTITAALLLAYIFWRLSSIDFFKKRRPALLAAALILEALLVSGRYLGRNHPGPLTEPLELISFTLIGGSLLAFLALLPVELATGFGLFLRRFAGNARKWALTAGILLAGFALFQGTRPPAIESYQVGLAGLPPELDGTTIVALADLHLGSQIGPGWLERRVSEALALQPDLIVLLGDTFEGRYRDFSRFFPALRRLRAPLGVWAVDGNHDRFGSSEAASSPSYPLRTLRNEVVEVAPGLRLAGRSVLTRSQRREGAAWWVPPSAGRESALVLLSHYPEGVREAARAGVGLLLCGHTHGGQIWPLNYFAARSNTLLSGRYRFGAMTAIVSRGTGTWGPRMRLWKPGEISLITLRTPGRPG